MAMSITAVTTTTPATIEKIVAGLISSLTKMLVGPSEDPMIPTLADD